MCASHSGPVQQGQPLARAQVRFGVGLQAVAGFGHRAPVVGGGQHVQQRLARTRVHAHVAHGGDGHAGETGHTLRGFQQQRVVRTQVQRQAQRSAVAEPGLEPHRVGKQGLEEIPSAGRDTRRTHHQQRQAIGQPGQHGRGRHTAFDVGHQGDVFALGRAAARHGDPLRQVAIPAARHGQHGELRACGWSGRGVGRLRTGLQLHQGADDQGQAILPRLHVRTHDTGERALVGDGQCGVAQGLRAGDQFLGVRSPVQEAEIAAADQLGVGRKAARHGRGSRTVRTVARAAAGSRSGSTRRMPGGGGSCGG